MKWMIMAAVTLALLFCCVFMMINKQEQLSVITSEVQTYMGQRDKLQKEVGDLQGHRDRRAALDKEWDEFKTKEGELRGKYGDKLALEGECAKLTERHDGLATRIKAMEEQVASLQGRVTELVNQTNILGKTMDSMLGERDTILEETERFKKERDTFYDLRRKEEKRYTEQKAVADQEAARADTEENRANEAKRLADNAVKRKENAKQEADAAETAQKKRVADLRVETDKEIAAQEKRRADASTAAADAIAKAEAEETKLKTLAAEVAKLEARRAELNGIEKQLTETKAALANEQEKLGQVSAKVTAQQIAAQIDDVREDVSRRLGVFGAKLEEFETKQNAEAKQGGLE